MPFLKRFFLAIIFVLVLMSVAFWLGTVTSEYQMVNNLRATFPGWYGLLTHRYNDEYDKKLYLHILWDNIYGFPKSLVLVEPLIKWGEFLPGGCAYYEDPKRGCQRIKLEDKDLVLELCKNDLDQKDPVLTKDILIESTNKSDQISFYKNFDSEISRHNKTVIFSFDPSEHPYNRDLWINNSGEQKNWIYSYIECDGKYGESYDCHIDRICLNRGRNQGHGEIKVQLH